MVYNQIQAISRLPKHSILHSGVRRAFPLYERHDTVGNTVNLPYNKDNYGFSFAQIGIITLFFK